jgi:tRNA dimethylallyltransferase
MSTSETSNSFDKVIVILGPTGSGKTGMAVKLAKAINGEVISADSRAIYKGMDVGTAKPSVVEMEGVPHFGLDLVEPGERFTVADFKAYAEEKIAEIRSRGHVPIIAGGTGLYIDALVYDYQFGNNQKTSAPDRGNLCTNYLLIGVKWGTEELRERLKKRLDVMFDEPLYTETCELVQKYGWGSQAMKSNVYKFVWQYLNGEISLEEAKEKSFYEDWHLAKRQLTWFKRTPEIIWLELEKIYTYVLKYIQDEQRN